MRSSLRKYPWDEWLSVRTEIQSGRDYDTRPDVMAILLRRAAARRGITLSIKRTNGTIRFRAVPCIQRRKHPWSTWLDGRVHVATEGTDYDRIESMTSVLANQARRTGVSLEFVRRGEGMVVFRFTPRPGA